MNHIIVDFKPFILNQSVMVYVDGECVFNKAVGINHITETVEGLRKQYNINQIDLCGNQYYLSRIQKEMMTKFSDNEYDINIIER